MRIEINEELIKFLGKALADSYDSQQALFLNSFADELHVSYLGKESNLESQHCYISDKLTKHSRSFILSLAEFIKLREES